MSIKVCDWCGEPENEDDAGFQEVDGEQVCWPCYRDQFLQVCGRCEESFEQDGGPGGVLAVYDDDLVVRPGYYQIIKWPFYIEGIGTLMLFADALRYIGPLLPGEPADGYDYPTAMLCPVCIAVMQTVAELEAAPAGDAS